MNIDLGLYVKFDVHPGNEDGYGQGRPTGCSGLYRDDWLNNLGERSGKISDTPMSSYDASNYLNFTSKHATNNEIANPRYSDVVVGERFSGCPLNDNVVENGEKMNEIFEAFANDNQLWVNEFVAVFQKMLENGYQIGNENGNDELQKSEIPWQEVTCDNSGNTCSLGNSLIFNKDLYTTF